MQDGSDVEGEDLRPLVAPARAIRCRDCLGWLAAGWRDLCAAPRVALAYGAVIVLVSVVVSSVAWMLGRFALLATLLTGFVFVAPMLAVGLYSVSRDLERGARPSLRRSFALMRRCAGQGAVYALVLLVILLLWSRAGLMVNVFFPAESGDWRSLVEYLLIGSAVGSVFAAFTFATAAFSLPMIADRDTDMITAALTSANAVLRNKPQALVWAVLLALITGVGVVPVFLGLAVTMPWAAFSAWHAYRAVIDVSAWPPLLPDGPGEADGATGTD